MTENVLAKPSERLVSLDVFRGMTIALMVLVNNPGSWGSIYDPLEHAAWDGWTPTDFVFPFFLFIVGVAMTLSFDKRMAKGAKAIDLFAQVIRRSIIIFALGLILGSFPNFRLMMPYILTIAGLSFLYANDPILSMGSDAKSKRNKMLGWGILGAAVLWFIVDFNHFQSPVRVSSFAHMFPLTSDLDGGILRIPGVLQRIAVCYFFASIIVLTCQVRGRLVWTLLLLNVYWIIMEYIHPPAGYELGQVGTRDATPGAPFPGGLNDWIDIKLLGDHLYSRRPDPEGILSTIPAIATVLLGILTGNWLQTDREKRHKATEMAIAGGLLLILGACMHSYFPINKKIWTSSYVVFMGGWSLVILALCYYLADVKQWRSWTPPFLVFGTNAILIFFASGILARLLGMIKLPLDGNPAVKTYLYGFYTSTFEKAEAASLAWAISYILLWLVLTYPLYRKKIFLKV